MDHLDKNMTELCLCLRNENIWYSCVRWPSLGSAIIDAIAEVSIVISIICNSILHLITPIKDWKYVTSIGDNSLEISVSGL